MGHVGAAEQDRWRSIRRLVAFLLGAGLMAGLGVWSAHSLGPNIDDFKILSGPRLVLSPPRS